MRHHLRNPDLGMHLINGIFTIGSTGLSGYCGWLLADGQMPVVRMVSALLFATIAVALSNYVVRRERYELSLAEAEQAKDKIAYLQNEKKLKRAKRAVLVLLVANLATDYSASAALRNLTIVKADNANTIATNARTEVSRLESRIKDLKGERAWINKYESPASYQAMIESQKQITDRGRNVYARTKECTDTTLAVSQAVCQRIHQLEAEKANAQRRQVVLSELSELEKQLVAAKAGVKESPKAANAALAPIVQLVQILTQSLDQDKDNVQWGLNYFVLFMTAVFSAGIYFCSAELGSRMGPMSAPMLASAPPAPRRNRPKFLEAPEPDDAAPIPLKAEDPPNKPAPGGTTSTVNISYSGSHDKDAISRLMRELEEDFGLTAKH